MMSRPKLILLDEPSMGLAPQVVEEIFEIVRGLNEREGVSFLLAEQNTNIALRYASFGYILETGRVVLDGAAEALEDQRGRARVLSRRRRREPALVQARQDLQAPQALAGVKARTTMSEDARFGRLRDRLGELHGRSHALARQIGDVEISDLRGPADLALIPVLRKSALAEMQRAEPPFGGLAAAPTGSFPRLFASPGGLYEPESAGADPWGAAKAFAAAGVEPARSWSTASPIT